MLYKARGILGTQRVRGLEEVIPKIRTSYLTTDRDEESMKSTRTTDADIYNLRKVSTGEPKRVLISKNANSLLTYKFHRMISCKLWRLF